MLSDTDDSKYTRFQGVLEFACGKCGMFALCANWQMDKLDVSACLCSVEYVSMWRLHNNVQLEWFRFFTSNILRHFRYIDQKVILKSCCQA